MQLSEKRQRIIKSCTAHLLFPIAFYVPRPRRRPRPQRRDRRCVVCHDAIKPTVHNCYCSPECCEEYRAAAKANPDAIRAGRSPIR
jgi:hypothetical protein